MSPDEWKISLIEMSLECKRPNVRWHVRLFATPPTVAHQVPLSMGFPRQEYRSGFSFPTPRNLLDPRIEPIPPASSSLAGEFFTTEPHRKPQGQLSA